MMNAYTCTPIYFYIQKRSPPLLLDYVDYYVVDLVDCTAIGGFPGEFVNILVGEDCTPYYTVIVQTKINQPFSIVINAATAMPPHGNFTVALVRANFSVNISHYQNHIILRDSRYFILELVLPVVLYRILSLVSRGITLKDNEFTVLGIESRSNDSVADRLPFNEGLFCTSADDKGNTTSDQLACAFSFPENKLVKPSAVVFLPAPVHLHSLTPRMSKSYLSISFVTCAVLPVSNIVPKFHVASRIIVLGPRKLLHELID